MKQLRLNSVLASTGALCMAGLAIADTSLAGLGSTRDPMLWDPIDEIGAADRSMALLVLLPLAAAIVAGLRTVVGLQPFGTFAPVLLGIAFVYAGPAYLFLAVVASSATFAVQPAFAKLRIARQARLAALIGLVVVAWLFALRDAPNGLGFAHGAPVIVTVVIVDRLWSVVTEVGALAAVRSALHTTMATALVLLLIGADVAQSMARRNPYLCVSFGIVLAVAAGSYRGLRVTELRRFRPRIDATHGESTAARPEPRLGGVLGMNARNALIRDVNPAEAVRLVNRKHETKQALESQAIPVAPTIGVAATDQELAALTASLPDRWAMKPNRGLAGRGILLATDRSGCDWILPSGRRVNQSDVRNHGEKILSGEYSMGDDEDQLLLEPLLRPHAVLSPVTPSGLPDLRVIAYQGKALAAMVRLPTSASDGKANLHQNGIGLAIDLVRGTTTHAFYRRRWITHHPDTGRSLAFAIPDWSLILDMAERCGPAVGLGYLGADIVLDATLDPVVIEVNAQPGLEIQNVCHVGLRAALASQTANTAPTSVPTSTPTQS